MKAHRSCSRRSSSLAIAGRAHAYPQFQLVRDQTCTRLPHLARPAAALLNENGLAVAEAISKFGTDAEFMYGKVKTPAWLPLGGDFRGATGYLQTPQRYLLGFPMQADLYARASVEELQRST